MNDLRSLVAACLTLLSACAHAAPEGVVRTEAASFRVTQVAGGLDHPWALAFLPAGGILVTEREGRLRLIENGALRAAPIEGLPPIYTDGQGGLLDVTLDPAFAQNRRLYLSYAHEVEGETTTRVMRAVYTQGRLTRQQVIFEAEPMVRSSGHFGSRFAWLSDGSLVLTMGERMSQRDKAQDLGTHLGKTLRITTDGDPAPGNPFLGRAGALPEIYTYGHRNPQGLAAHPATGRIWEQEHGARGGDEINLLKPGANYGWPNHAYGVNYSGTTIGTGQPTAPGIEPPLHYWDPSIAPSGMTFYTGEAFPGWRGDLLVGALKDQLISRLDLDEQGRVLKEERFLQGRLGRIRDVRTGPDGLVYLVTDESPGGVYRLEPAGD